MIYSFNDISSVHLEISSLCNAQCPLCPRNLFGSEYNDGYEEHNMSLDEVKKILTPDFLQQINYITINGNFGDMVMNPETLDIISYFKEFKHRIHVNLNTNGGARNSDFWTKLAKFDNLSVIFAIDGLEDTHSIYRRNTVFKTVIENAQTYINAGGWAMWRMIDFDHNRHQQDQARELSKQLGFAKFEISNHNRNKGPVFNRRGEFQYVIGPYTGTTNYTDIVNQKAFKNTLSHIKKDYRPIKCMVQKDRSIYVTSVGEVYPCCFLGFSPNTYGHGNSFEVINAQIRELAKENNALIYGIEHATRWFDRVSETWLKPSYEEGRLIMCNDICGCRALT